MRRKTSTLDPIDLIERLDADAIRAELDALYRREAALRAALKVARARQRARSRTPRANREDRHAER
jgi:hypothetical protein